MSPLVFLPGTSVFLPGMSPFIVLPAQGPSPIPGGFAAFSGADDFAVSGDGLIWPTGQVSMNTGLGGNRFGNTNLVYDLAADLWIVPGESGGGVPPIRSTDLTGTSWTTWPIPTGLTNVRAILYDPFHSKLIAVDNSGNVSTASTWNGTWVNTVSGGQLLNRDRYGDIGWNPLAAPGSEGTVVFSGTAGSSYSDDGGVTWTNFGTVGSGGVGFNKAKGVWHFVNITLDDITTSLNTDPSSTATLEYNGSGTNMAGIAVNPDTGTAITVDWSLFRTMYRRDGITGLWSVINSGQGFGTDIFRSVFYDRDNSRWLVGDTDGEIWASTDDGLTFTKQNGGSAINNGAQFFNDLWHLGSTKRYLTSYVQ